MAKLEDDREAHIEKLERLRERWKKSDAAAKAANMEIGAEKKRAQDAIRTAAGKLGYDKGAWNDHMTRLDHADEFIGHREKVVAHEDEDRLRQYDQLFLTREELLPLFSAEEIEEITTSAESVPVEANVEDLNERRKAKAKATEAEAEKEAAAG